MISAAALKESMKKASKGVWSRKKRERAVFTAAEGRRRQGKEMKGNLFCGRRERKEKGEGGGKEAGIRARVERRWIGTWREGGGRGRA